MNRLDEIKTNLHEDVYGHAEDASDIAHLLELLHRADVRIAGLETALAEMADKRDAWKKAAEQAGGVNPDRTVHASGGTLEVVRYDRAGKWYCESTAGHPRVAVTVDEAVGIADSLWKTGGSPHFGRRGGSAFDRKLRAKYSKAPR